MFDRTLPPALAELNAMDFDYDDGEGIDFEPYDKFEPLSENQNWIRAWTGNQDLDGAEFRIFGQDGTGGYAAFWLVNEGKPIVEQPIVFFGSEGEIGVVASNLDDYLWLLADGTGPMEAAENRFRNQPNAGYAAVAMKHARDKKKSAKDVVAAARKTHPDFEKRIRALCK